MQFIALGKRLSGVPEVLTLGVRPNFFDYTPEQRNLILHSKAVLFPTLNYAQFLTTLGKPIFPSLETYLYAGDKIKQTTLFYMLGIPHPKTRFYYHLHFSNIMRDFDFPFVAKLPRSSARGRGVYKIGSCEALEEYLRLTKVAYIQEYLPHDRDLRVILINYRIVLAYWRIARPGSFKTNISQGGRIEFDNIPAEPLMLAERTARMCRFNDVGLDLIHSNGKWYVIEANMKYGRKGLKLRELDLKQLLREMLLSGQLLP